MHEAEYQTKPVLVFVGLIHASVIFPLHLDKKKKEDSRKFHCDKITKDWKRNNIYTDYMTCIYKSSTNSVV